MVSKQFHTHEQEKGQSIVVIALVLVGLLAMVGLAVDVGLVFSRGAALSKAVDSAVLAAVTEVIDVDELDEADLKAGQFLNANGMPVTVTQSLNTAANLNDLGAIQYSVTATWPVELYFLKLIGRTEIAVTRSATAAYFPVTDIYASRRVEDGALTTSNQAVFGPLVCTSYGDPFSPLSSPYHSYNDGVYRYRILIPGSYPYDIVRVELFDPDSYNTAGTSADVAHTDAWIADGRPPVETLSCPTGGPSNQVNPCLIDTREDEELGLPLDQVNPWWFLRIDENRYGNGSGSGCNTPTNYTPAYNTQTLYQLYYYRSSPSGAPIRNELAQYTGQVNDGVIDSGEHDTDLLWVSPGGAQSWDQDIFVPADFGSFEVSISNDLTEILEDPGTGNKYLYLDVSTQTGSSENGFEIWAGPNIYVGSTPSDVNYRNTQVISEPGSHNSMGVTVFGMGNLPLNSNYGGGFNWVDIPLLYIPPEYAGKDVYISLFDPDSGAQAPIAFYFDSLAFSSDPEDTEGDGDFHFDTSGGNDNACAEIGCWAKVFAVSGTPDPDGEGGRCGISNNACNSLWIDPAYRVRIPAYDAEACAADPTNIDICTPFFGGRLVAHYRGGSNDSYGWQIALPGLPYLVR